MTTTVPATSDRVRQLVDPALRGALARLSPEVARVAGYHLGFIDAAGWPVAVGGGKAVRPALTLLAAEATGGPVERALPGAVAVELVHNFSLLHDDVMDDDVERRHRPTAWTVFGVGAAILAGDALLALAQQVLLEDPTPERVRAASAVAEATGQLIVGQGADLAFEHRRAVTLDECLTMCGRKTGALLACAAAVGAILVEAPAAAVEGLAGFGRHLGLAFQAVDDLLGIWGRPEVTGKPAWSDLKQRKKSLPVVAALHAGGHAAEHLAALLAAPTLDEAAVELAARLVDEGGGRAWTAAEADRQLMLALDCLEGVLLDSRARDQLAALARFVVIREC